MSKAKRNQFKEMSGKDWVKALNRLESRPDVPITLSGGEPMMHPDFIYILNHLKPELNIDVLTNFSYKRVIDELIAKVKPERLRREAPYPSIRVSYHPGQQDPEVLITNVRRAQEAGFKIGIYSVLYPSSKQLEAIVQMQFRCKQAGVEFRVKDFTGTFAGELYGSYSKYPNAALARQNVICLCKTSELLIGPNGNVYKCHRDLYAEENPEGNITQPDFRIEQEHRICKNYGECHPCDVKVKTNFKQELGHTSVDIKEVK
jgi:MoaA/NifB/PqqE/SkfB family radical SAM enzyme